MESILLDTEHQRLIYEYNELLAIHGAGRITYEYLKQLNKFQEKFEKLAELYIDGNNYKDKVKAYKKHRKNLIEDFGYEIPKLIPFDSPHELKLEFDKYLVDIGLEPEQVSILTKEILGSDRRPRKKDIGPDIMVSKGGKIGLVENVTPTRLRAHKEKQKNTSLSQEVKDQCLLDKIHAEFDYSYDESKAIMHYINEHHNGSFKEFLQALLPR